jgi:hypothetical protein
MKKQHILLSSIILFFLFIISCKKDDVKEVYAGRYDQNFIFRDFTPPVEFQINWDEQNLYGYGQDSLDLDLDNNYDLVFKLNIINYDSIQLIGGFPNPFPNFKVYLKNGFEIAFCTESYYVGLGQTNTANFADTLALDERIDLLNYWYSGPQNPIAMWQENPGSMSPSYGPWYYTSKMMYIGIRKDKEHCGWIAVDESEPYHPRIAGYALLK